MRNRSLALTLSLGLVLLFTSLASAQYTLTDLTSNQSGVAPFTDPLLVNAWGLAYSPTGPFWISDEGDGWSTLYTGTGAPQSLKVVVPPASGSGAGSPTGIVYNASQQFVIDGWVSAFLFDTLDGTIQGWSSFSPGASIIAINNPGSVYTGLAITSHSTGNMIYAADFANNKVDVYDGTFSLVTSFTDSGLPSGFAPFNVQDIAGRVYVTFAATDGKAGGYVDVFSEAGVLTKRLIKGSPLNQPWGIAVAPTGFGSLSKALLIGNNINGKSTISGFNPNSGAFIATMKDSTGKAIEVDQLWGIEFGGGASSNGSKTTLYFTAGPNNNVNGLFGSIAFQ
jgi:uncharacterized protein (TIGR03118 family)